MFVRAVATGGGVLCFARFGIGVARCGTGVGRDGASTPDIGCIGGDTKSIGPVTGGGPTGRTTAAGRTGAVPGRRNPCERSLWPPRGSGPRTIEVLAVLDALLSFRASKLP